MAKNEDTKVDPKATPADQTESKKPPASETKAPRKKAAKEGGKPQRETLDDERVDELKEHLAELDDVDETPEAVLAAQAVYAELRGEKRKRRQLTPRQKGKIMEARLQLAKKRAEAGGRPDFIIRTYRNALTFNARDAGFVRRVGNREQIDVLAYVQAAEVDLPYDLETIMRV